MVNLAIRISFSKEMPIGLRSRAVHLPLPDLIGHLRGKLSRKVVLAIHLCRKLSRIPVPDTI
jgi:hypothetical protein